MLIFMFEWKVEQQLFEIKHIFFELFIFLIKIETDITDFQIKWKFQNILEKKSMMKT
jgi:hypothetical protein